MIERAINLVQGGYIEERHIILDTRYAGEEGGESLLKDDRPLRQILQETEKRVLKEAVERLGSSRRVGAVLGISHTAVIKKMKKYGIRP